MAKIKRPKAWQCSIDRQEQYGYHVRNGIAAFYTSLVENSDVVFNISSYVVYDFVLGKQTIESAIESGKGSIDGI